MDLQFTVTVKVQLMAHKSTEKLTIAYGRLESMLGVSMDARLDIYHIFKWNEILVTGFKHLPRLVDFCYV